LLLLANQCVCYIAWGTQETNFVKLALIGLDHPRGQGWLMNCQQIEIEAILTKLVEENATWGE